MTQVPGRGKKQCPQCKTYIGVRNAKCPECNHEFGVKVQEKVAVQEPEQVSECEGAEPKRAYATQIIAPGTGWPANHALCPVDLPEPNKEAVYQWIEDCQDSVSSIQMEYSRDALIYMIKFAGKVPNQNLDKIRPFIDEYFSQI